MNIPEKFTLKIGAILWKVEQVEESEIDSDYPCSGDTSHVRQTIRLNRNLSDEMKEQTLFHEIFHALDIELDHNAVEMLATLLHQVLKENKLLA